VVGRQSFLLGVLSGDELRGALRKKEKKNFLTEKARASKSPRRFSAAEKAGSESLFEI